MARGPLHLVVNITAKNLCAPDQTTELQFCSLLSYLSSQKRTRTITEFYKLGSKSRQK